MLLTVKFIITKEETPRGSFHSCFLIVNKTAE